MRVDGTAPPSPPGYPPGNTYPAGSTYPADFGDESITRLKRYLKALQRRWPVLLVFTLLGALVGWVTTPGERESGPLSSIEEYYKATHTLIGETNISIGDEGGTSTTPFIDLTQASYLATVGEVPRRVAEELGISVADVESSVSGTARGDVNTIELTAIGTSPASTIQLADTVAAELVTYLNEQAVAKYDRALEEARADLEELDQRRSEIQRQLAAGEGDPEDLDAQLQAVYNRSAAAYQRWENLTQIDNPTPGLSTLDTAQAVKISPAAYDRQKEQILLGPSYVPPTTGDGSSTSDLAAPPADPPDPGIRAMLGAVLALGLAVGLVLGLDRFDTRLRRRDDVEAVTSLPVLAEIPPMSRAQQAGIEVVAATNPRSRAAEAYRVVRSAIMFAATAELAFTQGNGNGARGTVTSPQSNELDPASIGPQVILVTSPGPGEGKTTTVANLAAVLAEGGLTVLVINCDFRRPRVHKYLVHDDDSQESSGGAALGPSGDLANIRATKTEIPRVRLVTGIGEDDPHANPLEIVAIQRRIVQAARKHFDIVLLDTAPILTTNDASELLPESDQVLMVIRNGKTRRESARRTAEVLARFEAPTLGVVFNGSDDTPTVQYYYNYYLDPTGNRVRGPGYLDPTGPKLPTPSLSKDRTPGE